MKNEKGLTLIEVLASIALLGLLMTMFGSLNGYIRLSDNQSDRKNEGHRLVENMISETREKLAQERKEATEDDVEFSQDSLKDEVLDVIQNSYTTTYGSAYSFHYNVSKDPNPSAPSPCGSGQPVSSSTTVVLDESSGSTVYIVSFTACWGE